MRCGCGGTAPHSMRAACGFEQALLGSLGGRAPGLGTGPGRGPWAPGPGPRAPGSVGPSAPGRRPRASSPGPWPGPGPMIAVVAATAPAQANEAPAAGRAAACLSFVGGFAPPCIFGGFAPREQCRLSIMFYGGAPTHRLVLRDERVWAAQRDWKRGAPAQRRMALQVVAASRPASNAVILCIADGGAPEHRHVLPHGQGGAARRDWERGAPASARMAPQGPGRPTAGLSRLDVLDTRDCLNLD